MKLNHYEKQLLEATPVSLTSVAQEADRQISEAISRRNKARENVGKPHIDEYESDLLTNKVMVKFFLDARVQYKESLIKMDYVKMSYPEAHRQAISGSNVYFPTKGQLSYKDKGEFPIVKVQDNNPLLFPMLNLIFNHNRYWKPGEAQFDNMVREADKVTGGKRYMGKEEGYLSTFFGTKEFYEDIAQMLGAKSKYLQQVYLGVVEIGGYEREGRSGNIHLYSDGHFQRLGRNWIKHPWLLSNNKTNRLLASFKPKK